MLKSLKSKSLVQFFIILILSSTVGIVANSLFLAKYYVDESKELFHSVSHQVSNSLQLPKRNQILFDLDKEHHMSVLVLNTDLLPVVASFQLPDGVVFGIDHIILELAQNCINLDYDQYIYKEMHDKNNSTQLVFMHKQADHYVILIRPMHSAEESMDITKRFMVMASITTLVIGSIVIVIFSDRFTKPIIRISQVATQMSKLDFSHKIDYQGTTELENLSNSINFLSTELEKNIQQLQQELEFQKILSSSMSHELKTPIAVIKGYVEGVYYQIAQTPDEKEEYLKTAIDECDRMNNIVSQMLELSKFSSTSYKIHAPTTFTGTDLILNISKIFTPLMDKENIDFTTNTTNQPMTGDFSLYIQIITNLVSNAIKYGDKLHINLDIQQTCNKNTITVTNTGPNIPNTELQNIFNTFYTVDTARTRDTSGHGLGLAIVKAIAKLHKGDVTAENTTTGVTFIVTLENL